MRSATDVLRAQGVEVDAPESVREGRWPPVLTALDGADDEEALVAAVREEIGLLEGGKLAVVLAPRRLDAVTQVLLDALGPDVVGAGARALDAAVGVLTVEQVKGLEFDGVVLLEPVEILEDSPRGGNDLYVAMTRPTQRLRVLHAKPLPEGF